jgi:hypothetical protein
MNHVWLAKREKIKIHPKRTEEHLNHRRANFDKDKFGNRVDD